jgi:dUTP pyrophosphatase
MLQLGVYALNSDVELPKYGTSLSSCFDIRFCPTTNIIEGYDENNVKVKRFVLIERDEAYITIHPGDRLLVPTGMVFCLNYQVSIEDFADIVKHHDDDISLRDFSIRLHPRSGLALKQGLVLANCEGVVDADYQNEVFVMLHNISKVTARINRGDRIAQGEVVCNEPFSFYFLKEMPKQISERNGGFGSTGVAS